MAKFLHHSEQTARSGHAENSHVLNWFSVVVFYGFWHVGSRIVNASFYLD